VEPNCEAYSRFQQGDAVLTRLAPARELLPALSRGKVLTHAGPPIAFESMCQPMRGGLAGAAVFERWAKDPAEATNLLASGEVVLLPNHHAGSVSPMAGVISPSMLAWEIRNPTFGNTAVTILNEGNVPDSLRCGANGPNVIERLHWLNEVVAPAVAASIPDGLSIRDLIAQAVLMGDEMHQRNVAGSLLFLRVLLPRLLRHPNAAAAVEYFSASPQSFLNVAMAASKAMLDPLSGIRDCTVVTALSRNGVEFGIRVSGTGDRWFTSPSPLPRGVYWPGFGPQDSNPDIGDSAIVETAGLGGFALAGAPALLPLVGCGGLDEARSSQQDLRQITINSNPFYMVSPVDDLGTPFGIDVSRVVETGITPLITTGIAHREAGVGQVGVGMVRAPLDCFVAASEAMAKEYAAKGASR
jgi:Protein of unknown function (DUF1116)